MIPHVRPLVVLSVGCSVVGRSVIKGRDVTLPPIIGALVSFISMHKFRDFFVVMIPNFSTFVLVRLHTNVYYSIWRFCYCCCCCCCVVCIRSINHRSTSQTKCSFPKRKFFKMHCWERNDLFMHIVCPYGISSKRMGLLKK